MTTRIVSPNDGPRWTINELIGMPLMIPARILDLLGAAFLSSVLLRNAGRNNSGLISFHESTPLYLDGNIGNIAEFGEIPVMAGQKGLPRIVMSTEQGAGIRISKKMRQTNNVAEVLRQITQLTNSMVRADELMLRALFDNPAIPTIAAAAPWDTTNGVPRLDIADAKQVIKSARPAGSSTDTNFRFNPNTIVLPGDIEPVLEGNANFTGVYAGRDSLVSDDIRYTGKLPTKIGGLDALESYSFADNKVLVLERGTTGFYSDLEELGSTGLYPEGGGPNGGPTQSWRSDTTRERGAGIDQPLAACWITGVKS